MGLPAHHPNAGTFFDDMTRNTEEALYSAEDVAEGGLKDIVADRDSIGLGSQ